MKRLEEEVSQEVIKIKLERNKALRHASGGLVLATIGAITPNFSFFDDILMLGGAGYLGYQFKTMLTYTKELFEKYRKHSDD